MLTARPVAYLCVIPVFILKCVWQVHKQSSCKSMFLNVWYDMQSKSNIFFSFLICLGEEQGQRQTFPPTL